MPRPRINLMVMREGDIDHAVRSYSLPGYIPRVAIVVGAILLIIVLTALFAGVYYWHRASTLKDLTAENAALHESLLRMTQLESELEYYRQFTQRIAGLIGVKVPAMDDSLSSLMLAGGAMPPAGSSYFAGLDSAGPLDVTSPVVGVLVVNCEPDPENRPRGLPLLGRLSRGYQPSSVNPSLRHQGIDIAAREGSPVFAPASGVVEFSGPHEVFGLMLTIDHRNGFKTIYGHNSKLFVETGDKIRRGEVVALSGNTGISTAPHLHYEILRDNNAVDPSGFLGK
ncbi:MAG: peptidoglycan DD-metalloendopeptidase family protein [Candidatus Zixiibacteriota bacterium]